MEDCTNKVDTASGATLTSGNVLFSLQKGVCGWQKDMKRRRNSQCAWEQPNELRKQFQNVADRRLERD